MFNLLSAIALNLVTSKILSFGKELNAVNYRKIWRTRLRMFIKIVGEYGPSRTRLKTFLRIIVEYKQRFTQLNIFAYIFNYLSTENDSFECFVGESQANGNGPTPNPSPPGSPKRPLSRSSSPQTQYERQGKNQGSIRVST